ncbi:MAG: phospho-sugar mutase [archaeon]
MDLNVDRCMNLIDAGFVALKAADRFKAEARRNIRSWLCEDEFKSYRDQIVRLIDLKEFDLLLDCFYQVIPFGTGGRRGPVGIGTNRINPWTIAASAQGHSEYLIRQYGPSAKGRGVVLAYDVRKYPETGIYDDSLENPVKGITSKDLAAIAAEVYAANGIRVYVFDGIRTTPELSYAVRRLKAVAGDVFSASHNPKEDNGKKVYADHGGQLIPPEDQALADTVNAVRQIRRMPYAQAKKAGLVSEIGSAIDEAYLMEACNVSLRGDRDIRVLFSPLHGCGGTTVYRALKMLGFTVSYDPKTKTPDGGFPNVKFNIPNPEVEESFESLIESGADADILLNSDPDADRIGICVKHSGGFRYLVGNEIGVVLTNYILSTLKEKGCLPKIPIFVKTIVTCELSARIAEKFGCRVTGDLLVGFKYIANEIRKLEKAGETDRYMFGFEESHGCLRGTYTRDKDATSAAILLCELAAGLKRHGKTIVDYLEGIYAEYGYYKNHLSSIILLGAEGQVKIGMIQDTLRKNPPQEIGGYRVQKFMDLWNGRKHLSETDTAARNVLIFILRGTDSIPHLKISIRPSGTEPKTKIYIEAGGIPGKAHDQKIDDLVMQLEQQFVDYCYQIIGVSMSSRSFRLNWLLPVETKMRYFEVEKRIIRLKSLVTSGKMSKADAGTEIEQLLRVFGPDPIDKITKAFEEKTGSSLKRFLGFLR